MKAARTVRRHCAAAILNDDGIGKNRIAFLARLIDVERQPLLADVAFQVGGVAAAPGSIGVNAVLRLFVEPYRLTVTLDDLIIDVLVNVYGLDCVAFRIDNVFYNVILVNDIRL